MLNITKKDILDAAVSIYFRDNCTMEEAGEKATMELDVSSGKLSEIMLRINVKR